MIGEANVSGGIQHSLGLIEHDPRSSMSGNRPSADKGQSTCLRVRTVIRRPNSGGNQSKAGISSFAP